MADGHKYIFIGGLHRSGTWLHTHALELHPDLSRLGTASTDGDTKSISRLEGQFLQSVFPDDNYYGGVGRLGFHPQVHLTEASPLLTPENRQRLISEWSRYWDLEKQFLLEKTPANMLRARFLQEIFSPSYFIFIMRHPVAVALAQQKWSGTSVMSLIEHWLVCYEWLLEDIPFLENSLLLRYEDTVRDPDKSLARINSMLDIGTHAWNEKVVDGNKRYFDVWKRALEKKEPTENLSFRQKLRNRLMPKLTDYGYPLTILANETDTCVTRFEERVNRFGYSLKDPNDTRESPFH